MSAWEVHDSGIVYGPWLEGEGSRNKTTPFKGYRMFRKVATQINRKAARMLQPQTRRYVEALEK
jgi:hypothetical protein